MKYYAVVKEVVQDDGIDSIIDIIGVYTNKDTAEAVLSMASVEYEDMINNFDTVKRDSDCISAFDMGFYGSNHICIFIQGVGNDYFPGQPRE